RAGRAGPGQAGDVRFPGVDTLLQHQEGRRGVPTRAQDTEKANESQAPGDQGDTTTAQAAARHDRAQLRSPAQAFLLGGLWRRERAILLESHLGFMIAMLMASAGRRLPLGPRGILIYPSIIV